jgi:hypothetical protein
MAAETPFGASFGDPRRYMGQSPLAEIGKALKTGGILYGLEKSGAIKALDNMGLKSDGKGGFTYNKPAGSVAPTSPQFTAPPMQPVNPQDFGAPAEFEDGANQMPMSQLSPAQPAPPTGVQITPFGQDAPSNVQTNTFAPPPPDAGMQLMNNTYRPQSSVDVRNETDFNPLAPDTSNQFVVSGNDYQQIPGYGKLQRIAGQFMGMG